jgi:hypothetical protein
LRHPAVDRPPTPDDNTGVSESPTTLPVALPMRLLAAGVPLSLLLDLSLPQGPYSADICVVERPQH